MNLVQNDATAYKVAFEFVADDQDKLTVFTTALSQAVHSGDIENRSASATLVAKERWNTMFPPEAK